MLEDKKRIYALIPARSGSKSVINKNIRIMNGKPMIAYSIDAAKESSYISKTIVSTDSQQYAEIAREYGAVVPFLRPEGISGDNSLDIEVFQHFIRWMEENCWELPELIVHLRPTHPVRSVRDIDNMIEMMLNDPELDSVRSVAPAKQVPYKMWMFNDDDATMHPLITCDVPEAFNAPRQILPEVYMQNACIDIIRTSTIINQNSMTGRKIGGYKMSYDFDIDTEEDFLNAERFLTVRSKLASNKKIKIVCDIDGIIACKIRDNNYSLATAIEKNVSIIRKLHEAGHYIVLHTARGYATGLDWTDLTRSQMKEWDVPYDELAFGKPDADFYIDDKMISLDQLEAFI